MNSLSLSLHIDLVFTLISHMQELAENFEREKKVAIASFLIWLYIQISKIRLSNTNLKLILLSTFRISRRHAIPIRTTEKPKKKQLENNFLSEHHILDCKSLIRGYFLISKME